MIPEYNNKNYWIFDKDGQKRLFVISSGNIWDSCILFLLFLGVNLPFYLGNLNIIFYWNQIC